MTKYCRVVTTILVDDKVQKSKTWDAVNVMKTASTRAWTTRQFNLFVKDFGSTYSLHEKIIKATWDAYYEGPEHTHISGMLVGLKGRIAHRRGIFE